MAQKLIKYIEMDEFKKVLAAEKDRKFKLAYVLAMGSGLRISEVLGYEGISKKKNKETGEIVEKKIKIPHLTREQIDLNKHQIKILGKGSKERITHTSPWLSQTNIKLLPLKIPRRTLQGRFTRLCKKILKKNLSFHTLRHGWANHLANHPDSKKRMPLSQLQSLGGWSRLDTVGIYLKSNPIHAVDNAWESF